MSYYNDEYRRVESILKSLHSSLGALTQRQRMILCLRFGLNEATGEIWRRPYTLQEIGEMLHLSRERIRQIEAEALKAINAYESKNATPSLP